MRPFHLAAFALCCTLAAAIDSPDNRPITDPLLIASVSNSAAAPIDIDKLFNTRIVYGAAWSPDSKDVVFTTNISGRPNLWRVPASGGKPVQLSESDDRELSATWSPDGRSVAYQQDYSGHEAYDIFTVPPSGGAATNLTKTPEISETNPHWSPDGSSLSFDAKGTTSPITNIGVYDLKTGAARLLTHENSADVGWNVGDWSRTGKFLFAVRADVGYTDSNIFRIEVISGKAENLTPHHGNIVYGLGGVSPDGTAVLISSNEKGGFENVALLDVSSKKIQWVTNLHWEAAPGDFSLTAKASPISSTKTDRRRSISQIQRH